jgi:hypothetical protein
MSMRVPENTVPLLNIVEKPPLSKNSEMYVTKPVAVGDGAAEFVDKGECVHGG